VVRAHRYTTNDTAVALYERGVALDERGEHAVAEQLWREAAAAGHLNAQFALGVMLYSREDESSEAEAETLWRLAAAAGKTAAAYNLGVLLDQRSSAEAKSFWLLAASAGHVEGSNKSRRVVL
jgi:TPR repeat protein